MQLVRLAIYFQSQLTGFYDSDERAKMSDAAGGLVAGSEKIIMKQLLLTYISFQTIHS